MSHIQLPQPRKNWVRREQALNTLYSALDARLILVIAGAGYGKTGLLAQFAKIEGFTFSWLTLDEGDQDLRVFGEGLVESLRQCFPGFGHQTSQLLTSSAAIELNIGLLVRTFVRELSVYLVQPICMVLDDFHVVESSGTVINFVDRLITELPEEAHLILASRNLPPLQLGILIAQQQVSALGQSVLRLDLNETRQLIALLNGVEVSEIDEATASRELAATEGWLVGLLMTNHIERMREAQIGLGTPRAVDLLSDYLLVRVLQGLPPPLQEFLTRSSIMDEISIPFCAKEIGWADTANWIAELERRNLFIQPIGTSDPSRAAEITYRYHPLFRQFLLQRLREDDPIRYAHLQHDAGIAYERVNDIEHAIRHFLGGGWSEDAMRLTESYAPQLLERGRYRTVLEWLARLDTIAPGARAERHILWQFQIWAHLNLGEDTQAMAALDRLDDLYLRTGDLPRRDVLNIRRGLLLWRASDFENALACATTVIRSIYPQPLWARVEAHRVAAMCLYDLGRLTDALNYITQAEELTQNWGRSGYEALARIKLTRAEILNGIGDTAGALRAGAEALTLSEEIHDDGLLAESTIDMAELLLNKGAPDGLVDMVMQGLSLADATGNQSARISGLIVLAQALLTQGRYDEAEQAGANALTLARQITQTNERSRLLFRALIGQTYVLGRCARQEPDGEKRTVTLQQALGLAREAVAIADASQSTHARLQSYAQRGAVQVTQCDYQLAASSLSYAELIRGEFNDNAAGQVYVWQMMAEWEQPKLDIKRMQFLLDRINQIAEQRQQTYFISMEGDAVWQTFQDLRSSPDLAALHRARYQSALPGAAEPRGQAEAPVLSQQRIKLVQHDVRVFGFGTGRVYRGDEPITTAQWGWSIPRELFFYILTKRQATRADIGMTFWMDAPPASMQSSFHNAKFAIKTALGKPAMLYVNGAYSINPQLDYLYDVDMFEHWIATADQSQPAEALAALLSAIRLYQDDFLVDFTSEWVERTRTALSLKFNECCLRAGKIAVSMSSYDIAIDVLERAAQRDTINEEIARLLITAQWRSGRRKVATDTYTRLKNALQREIGILPDPETENLFRTLRASG